MHVQVSKGLIPSVILSPQAQTVRYLVDTPGSQLIGHSKMNLSCSSKTNISNNSNCILYTGMSYIYKNIEKVCMRP